jgi:hypothetical protein
MQKNIHWDTKQQELKRGDEIFCRVEKRHGQWVLEYIPISPATFSARSAQPRPDAEATADQWHQRLGHAGPDALEHLSAVIGAKLKGPSTMECEDCSLSKAHKQISRRTTPRALIPFEKVHFDLIQMSEGYNRDEWILHFLDDATRMNFVYTLPVKPLLPDSVQEFTTWVRRHYRYEVKTFRTDNETSLRKRFTTWVKDNGYTVESSTTYTPEQNGAAEKAGHAIIVKARLIWIRANLPKNLWPEVVRAAGYLCWKN